MTDLDKKLKEIRVNYRTWYSGGVCLLRHPHKGPCAGVSSEVGESAVGIPLDEDSIEQIKQAFKDAGYYRLVHLGKRYDFIKASNEPILTGQEWHGRFVNELGKPTYMNDEDGRHAVYKQEWVVKAAKRASGIEK